MQNFGILGQLLKLPPLSAQKCHSVGGRGVPNFFLIGIIIFLSVKGPNKMSEPYVSLLWDLSIHR